MENFKIDDVIGMREGRLSWQYYFKQEGCGKGQRRGVIRIYLRSEGKRSLFGNVLRNKAANQRPCRCVGKGPARDTLLMA